MKGFIYVSSIFIAFALTACSEAKFSNSSASAQKVQSDGDPVPVDQVPQDEMDDYTNAYACSHQASEKKALICHIPGGNFANAHDICISVNALPAHIGHHGDGTDHVDFFGSCDKVDQGDVDNANDQPASGEQPLVG